MAEKMLVIDDAPVIRAFLEDVLTDFGYEVETAENGQIGYEKAKMNEYAIIFCDVHMPVLNGLQTVIAIKKLKPESRIVITDSFPDRQAEQAAKAGAFCCLTKPFDLDELKAIIAKLIRDKVAR